MYSFKDTTEEEGPRLRGGQLLVALSDGIVELFRDLLGKGPERCKTYWAGSDTLLIMLDGGYTVAERTLFEAGRGAAVRESRTALQQILASRMKDTVEQLTGRSVVAFLSASHQDPDLSAEFFVLEPREPDTPAG